MTENVWDSVATAVREASKVFEDFARAFTAVFRAAPPRRQVLHNGRKPTARRKGRSRR